MPACEKRHHASLLGIGGSGHRQRNAVFNRGDRREIWVGSGTRPVRRWIWRFGNDLGLARGVNHQALYFLHHASLTIRSPADPYRDAAGWTFLGGHAGSVTGAPFGSTRSVPCMLF